MNRRIRFVSGCFALLAMLLLVTTVGCKSEAEVHYKRAKQLKEEERTDEAIKEYKLAAAADPTYAKPLYRLGQLYEHQEKYLLAAEYYRKAIDADPDYVRSYAELVKAWLRAEEFDKATAAAKDALGRKVVRRDMEATKEIKDLQVEIDNQRKAAAKRPAAAPTPVAPAPVVPTTPTSPTAGGL